MRDRYRRQFPVGHGIWNDRRVSSKSSNRQIVNDVTASNTRRDKARQDCEIPRVYCASEQVMNDDDDDDDDDNWRLTVDQVCWCFRVWSLHMLIFVLFVTPVASCIVSFPLLSPPVPSSPFFSLPLPSSPPSYHSFYLLAEFRSIVHRLQTSDISKPSPKTLVSRTLSKHNYGIFYAIFIFYKNFYRLQSTKDYLLDLQSTPQLP